MTGSFKEPWSREANGVDVVILYSESRRPDLLSLLPLLEDSQWGYSLFPLSDPWVPAGSLELGQVLRAAPVRLFLVDDEARDGAFSFALGFSTAFAGGTHVLGPAGSRFPWTEGSALHADLESLLSALRQEQRRLDEHRAHQRAREQLAERDWEVSNSAFLEVVEKGDVTSCELFLDAGFSPDLTTKKGVTALGLAVRAGHLLVVRLLLDRGADLNRRSLDRDNSPVMDAAAEGSPELVEELVRRGADLGGVSRNGQSALVLAIGKGAQDAAGLLLEGGADPFVADKLGMNACQYAQLLGRKEFLSLVAARYPGRI